MMIRVDLFMTADIEKSIRFLRIFECLIYEMGISMKVKVAPKEE